MGSARLSGLGSSRRAEEHRQEGSEAFPDSVVATAINAPLPLPKSVGLNRHAAAIWMLITAVWTLLTWMGEAIVWVVLVAILFIACALDGVNRFGERSDE